jgi:hypothetical protein
LQDGPVSKRGATVTIVSPVSTAVSAMNADRHQQHHHDESQRRHPEEAAMTPAALPLEEPHRLAAPPTAPQTPPEGTFIASQLAERLRLLEVNLRKLATGQTPWQPPHSELNLRDRTV